MRSLVAILMASLVWGCETRRDSLLGEVLGPKFNRVHLGRTTRSEFERLVGRARGRWHRDFAHLEAFAVEYDDREIVQMVVAWPSEEFGLQLARKLSHLPGVVVGATVDGQVTISFFEDRVRVLMSRDRSRVLAVAVRK